MKDNLSNIPELNLEDTEHFYVVGTKNRDGILGEYNLKTDLKAALYPPLVKPAYESVDLGLPSGTLWATMNVGATKPQQYGDYYAWGEVEIKDETAYTYNKYRFYPGNVVDEYTKYNSTDNKMTLDLTDDVANVVMGGKWHMPSRAQLNELTANTTSSWTTDYNGSGVAGAVFTSNINGNSIFFPAAGGVFNGVAKDQGELFGVWSSSRNAIFSSAWNLNGDSDGMNMNYYSRYRGLSVRGVLGELNDEEGGGAK